MAGTENTERMMKLDQAWNAQDWDTFDRFHSQATEGYWPAQPGRPAAEQITWLRPSNSSRRSPTTTWIYRTKVLFGDGDMTCSIARFTGTMSGPIKSAP